MLCSVLVQISGDERVRRGNRDEPAARGAARVRLRGRAVGRVMRRSARVACGACRATASARAPSA